MNGTQQTGNGQDRTYRKPAVQDQGLVRQLTRGGVEGDSENAIYAFFASPPAGLQLKARE